MLRTIYTWLGSGVNFISYQLTFWKYKHFQKSEFLSEQLYKDLQIRSARVSWMRPIHFVFAQKKTILNEDDESNQNQQKSNDMQVQ